jgi:hypothetical protein
MIPFDLAVIGFAVAGSIINPPNFRTIPSIQRISGERFRPSSKKVFGCASPTGLLTHRTVNGIQRIGALVLPPAQGADRASPLSEGRSVLLGYGGPPGLPVVNGAPKSLDSAPVSEKSYTIMRSILHPGQAEMGIM